MESEGRPASNNTPAQRPSWRYYFLVGALLLLGLYGFQNVFLRFLMHSHPNGAHESDAVATLKKLTALESRYSAFHPEKGFSCELRSLTSSVSDGDSFKQDSIFATGRHNGYAFLLGGCKQDDKGKTISYQLTATPEKPGRTGIRAFCADETGIVWYDVEGSSQGCLSARLPV